MANDKFYICTTDGVYLLDGSNSSKVCCSGYSVYDLALVKGGLLICSNERGLIYVKNQGFEELLIAGGCWRIFKLNEQSFIVSLEGPLIYKVEASGEGEFKTSELADLRDMAEKYKWWFPHGLPHLTDFTLFNDNLVASVEVGGVISSDPEDMVKWKLEGLEGVDAHNILGVKDGILVAAASGIYKSSNLKDWRKTMGSGGYNHALERCGKYVLSHKSDRKPLLLSDDLGESWVELDFELEAPTFGQTCLKCIDEKTFLYVPSKAYIVKIVEGEVIERNLMFPLVRRVVKFQ